jgi:hypothetical protein
MHGRLGDVTSLPLKAGLARVLFSHFPPTFVTAQQLINSLHPHYAPDVIVGWLIPPSSCLQCEVSSFVAILP